VTSQEAKRQGKQGRGRAFRSYEQGRGEQTPCVERLGVLQYGQRRAERAEVIIVDRGGEKRMTNGGNNRPH
jgi:hypothetical protein